jgi:hypothetical protein
MVMIAPPKAVPIVQRWAEMSMRRGQAETLAATLLRAGTSGDVRATSDDRGYM